jgi:hypothetical protein
MGSSEASSSVFPESRFNRRGSALGRALRAVAALAGVVAAGVAVAACSSSSSGNGSGAAYCEVHDPDGSLRSCEGFSDSNAATTSNVKMSCSMDAGGSSESLVSSCPANPMGCCDTTLSMGTAEVSDYLCYYGSGYSVSGVQGMCASNPGAKFLQNPPF